MTSHPIASSMPKAMSLSTNCLIRSLPFHEREASVASVESTSLLVYLPCCKQSSVNEMTDGTTQLSGNLQSAAHTSDEKKILEKRSANKTTPRFAICDRRNVVIFIQLIVKSEIVMRLRRAYRKMI